MSYPDYENQKRLYESWNKIRIERSIPYTLFTFGESELPYYLVLDAAAPGKTVTVTKGEIRITRPQIITPLNAEPEFQNFFADQSEEQMIEFLLARTAAFSHLRLSNTSGPARIVSDSIEEAVARLNRQLDDLEEDRVAILTAPADLGGVALLRYATERVIASAPGNVQELRDRGFLD